MQAIGVYMGVASPQLYDKIHCLRLGNLAIATQY